MYHPYQSGSDNDNIFEMFTPAFQGVSNGSQQQVREYFEGNHQYQLTSDNRFAHPIGRSDFLKEGFKIHGQLGNIAAQHKIQPCSQNIKAYCSHCPAQGEYCLELCGCSPSGPTPPPTVPTPPPTAPTPAPKPQPTPPTPAPKPGVINRINLVYYEQDNDQAAGKDFAELLSYGINSLSLSFYIPSATELVADSGSTTDFKRLQHLITLWDKGLGGHHGQIRIAFGGMNATGGSWKSTFQSGETFANNLITIHQKLTNGLQLKSCKVGFDLDMEQNDPDTTTTIQKEFGNFIKKLRSTLSPDACPLQIDGFSGMYRPDSDSHWQMDLLQKYGPKGTEYPNGYQYQGLMVDNAKTTGDQCKEWWNHDAYSDILPYTSRVCNFWSYPQAEYFPTENDALFQWMTSNKVSAAWWEWSPVVPGGKGIPENFIAVRDGAGFAPITPPPTPPTPAPTIPPGECVSINPAISDSWCTTNCLKATTPNCPAEDCQCGPPK